MNPTGQDSFMSQDGGIFLNVILSAFKHKDISRDTQIHEVFAVFFLNPGPYMYHRNRSCCVTDTPIRDFRH